MGFFIVHSLLFFFRWPYYWGGFFYWLSLPDLFQTGWIWRWQQNKKRGRPRFVFPILKVLVIAAIGYVTLRGGTPSEQLLRAAAGEKVTFIFKQVFFLALKIALALLLLGICDFFYQRWKYYRDMRMTLNEVKEEKRETEGDHKTKSRMRQR